MPCHLSISYSRHDDQQGQVCALQAQIKADYRSFAKEGFHCFYDLKDIARL